MSVRIRPAVGLIAIQIALAVSSPRDSRGDDGAILAVGGALSPMMEHPTIVMTAEFVHARVSPEGVRVECVFFLHNAGPATRVTIGFPCESGGADVDRVTPFVWFHSWVDGIPVSTAMKIDTVSRGPEVARAWYVKEVKFAAGQTRCIRDEYAAHLGTGVGDQSAFEYILVTGATWAGRIGTADIVLSTGQMDDLKLDYLRPEPDSVDRGELRWHFSDIEPGKDGAPTHIDVGWGPRAKPPDH